MAVDYTAWLKNSAAVRVVLIEVGVQSAGLETTRYLSTRPYVTGPADTPANQYYDPVVTTGIQFTEQLDLTNGNGSSSVGDIEITNINGERDSWLNDIWDNHSIKAYIGDPSWARADFQMIFNGVVGTLGSKSRDILNIILLDKLQWLNTPVTDAKIGGSGTNKDNIFNLSFGEVSNITPTLTNDVTLEYQYHDGPTYGVVEIRDNGKPIANDAMGWSGATVNAATGRFTLNRASAGTITCSVQGDATGAYKNTISKIIQRVVTGYGTAASRFTAADLDAANLAAFDTANPQAVGVYAEGRTNVVDLCQQLASSVGAQMVMSRLGLLRLIQLAVPGLGTPINIDSTQMLDRSLQIKSRPLVQSAFMLGFDKNYTVQEDLLTSIPDAHKQMFATEWLTATATSTVVQANYKLSAAPVQIDTCLCTRSDAMAEATRRLYIWATARSELSFEGTSDLLQTLELGMAVTITNRRFGLQNGKTGIVTSLAPNWLTGRVIVGVLV